MDEDEEIREVDPEEEKKKAKELEEDLREMGVRIE